MTAIDWHCGSPWGSRSSLPISPGNGGRSTDLSCGLCCSPSAVVYQCGHVLWCPHGSLGAAVWLGMRIPLGAWVQSPWGGKDCGDIPSLGRTWWWKEPCWGHSVRDCCACGCHGRQSMDVCSSLTTWCVVHVSNKLCIGPENSWKLHILRLHPADGNIYPEYYRD